MSGASLSRRVRALLGDQRIRFLMVGGFNVVFGYSMFGLMYAFVFDGLRLDYLASLIGAYVLAMGAGFYLYRRYVFEVTGTVLRDLGYYVAVNATGFALNALVLALLVELAGLPALLAQAVALVVTTLTSYLGHSRLSFGRAD